ncbi:MAG: aminopeptidase N [Micromonosporaceae bacterium]|nr:aminopeptidase N [Micromonosporaceae bacterium]
MATLTRAEAARRAALLDVRSYCIDLDLTRGAEEFGSVTVIRFGCARPGADTFVEVKPARLRRAVLDGVELDPGELDGDRLPLRDLAAENELTVEADMAYSHTGEGLHRSVDPVDGETYLYAQACMDDAQRIFPCFDQPDLKAAVTLTVTAPPEWTVLGNGAGAQTSPGRWEMVPTPPISTYLVTVVAGPYHSIYTSHDGIDLGLHCRRSLAAHLEPDADELFTVTRQCFDRYHELFALRYPFGKYDQVFVPDFNAGAMENPGCVTFRDDLIFRSAASEAQRELRAMVVAHEMAHMWFGDLVTLRWWDDVWLNESFAEYMGHRVTAEATRFADVWTTFSITRKGWGYAADQRPSTHPVASDVDDTTQAWLNFDGISYAKGASVLRQLVTWLGDEAFLAGLNDYFVRHQHGNATLADLLEALSAHTDRNLADWSRLWLRTPRPNTLRPAVTVDPSGRLASLEVEQTAPEAYPTLRPHRIAIGLYDLDGETAGAAIRRRDQVLVDLDPAVDGGRTLVPALAGAQRPALLLLNDEDLAYAKLRFDPGSWAVISEGLRRIDDSLTRALVWCAAWDMVRDGELPAAEFLSLVRAHLPHETAIGALNGVLEGARTLAVDWYTPPSQRDVALSVLAATCRELLAASAPGSSGQLLAARGLSRSAADPDDLTLLRGWLSGTDVPAGLVVGPDLRWAILLRLTVLGPVGEPEIAAELAADPSDEGQQGATRCRAALPDADAKQRAWEALTGDRLTPHLMLAAVEGLWQPEHADVLTDYLRRYFAELPEITARRGSPEVARVLARFGFPGYAASAETILLGEKLLARADVTPALARYVADELDEMRRAARSREMSATLSCAPE